MLPIGNRRRPLEDWLETTLRPWFSTRILPITEPVAERWGLLAAEARLQGVGLSVVDGLIAATAFEHDCANPQRKRFRQCRRSNLEPVGALGLLL